MLPKMQSKFCRSAVTVAWDGVGRFKSISMSKAAELILLPLLLN